MTSRSFGIGYVLMAVVYAAIVWEILHKYPRNRIPSHMLGHPAKWIEDFIDPGTHEELLELMKTLAVFPSNKEDLASIGFKPTHEHVGEAVPIGPNGTCSHKFLLPNIDRTLCILPQRIDIGRHFILTGGPDAMRESYKKMVSRLSSFGVYMVRTAE
jgi:hypothetical protein